MATNAAEVRKLRTELESRFGRAIVPSVPQPREGRGGLAAGVGPLDRVFPEGVARGRLTLWAGEGTSGRTAALRSLVVGCCAAGGTVAVVDAGRTLDASFGCTAAGPVEGLWLVRPPAWVRSREGGWAAEALLRTGVFDLVVLDGCLPESSEAHRLRALARDRDAALVVSVGMEGERERRARTERARGYRTAASRPTSGSRRKALRLVASGEERPGRHDDWSRKRRHSSPWSCGHSPASPPLPPSLPFRPDVRLEFRRREGDRGLGRGGRFRSRGRLRLIKGSSSALREGERELELVHEPANRVYPGPRIPDRSSGGR
jgi:hypothetical protein